MAMLPICYYRIFMPASWTQYKYELLGRYFCLCVEIPVPKERGNKSVFLRLFGYLLFSIEHFWSRWVSISIFLLYSNEKIEARCHKSFPNRRPSLDSLVCSVLGGSVLGVGGGVTEFASPLCACVLWIGVLVVWQTFALSILLCLAVPVGEECWWCDPGCTITLHPVINFPSHENLHELQHHLIMMIQCMELAGLAIKTITRHYRENINISKRAKWACPL